MIISPCKPILRIYFSNLGRNNFSLLSWHVNIGLGPYFKPPYAILFWFGFFFLNQCVCYHHGETQNIDLKICQWTPEMRQDFHGFTEVFKTSNS